MRLLCKSLLVLYAAVFVALTVLSFFARGQEALPGLAVKEVTSAELDAHLKGGDTVVVCFGASWCGPCRRLAPQYEAWSAKYGLKALFVKVDVDAEPLLAKRYGVRAVPAVFVQKGEVKVRLKRHTEAALAEALGVTP